MPRAKRPASGTNATVRPKDVMGFLFALPLDPSVEEVGRLAYEFGIDGSVEVKTYTSPDDNISFSLLEGDPSYVVTRYPRDMEGCIGRLADTLLEKIGSSMQRSATPANPAEVPRTVVVAPLPERSRTEVPSSATKATPSAESLASDFTPEEVQRLVGIFRLLLKWDDDRRKRREEK